MYADARPSIGHGAGRAPGGERVWVSTQDEDLMRAMQTEEFCGRAARIESGAIVV